MGFLFLNTKTEIPQKGLKLGDGILGSGKKLSFKEFSCFPKNNILFAFTSASRRQWGFLHL